MECQEVSQNANTLTVKLKFNYQNIQNGVWKFSEEYICGALNAKFASSVSYNENPFTDKNKYYITVLVRLKKILENDDSTYTCTLNGTEEYLHLKKIRICDDYWVRIACFSPTVGNYLSVITLNSEISEGQCILASIYDESESADFKLCGDGGSVPLHKTILAAHSPVLQRMLTGEWKESQEGSVALPGVSLETLQHLKDYMYLNRLPETGLQELCALASYYMMPRLVVQCCAKLLNYLTTDNAIDLVEFASKYRLRPLLIAILKTMGVEKDKTDKLSLQAHWPDIFCNKNDNPTENAEKKEH